MNVCRKGVEEEKLRASNSVANSEKNTSQGNFPSSTVVVVSRCSGGAEGVQGRSK